MILPSYSVRVTRRAACSQLTSRPCRSRVLPLVKFDGDTAFSRWLTGFCAWIRLLGFYYGDSGIFVRRSVYEALGGFRPLPVIEDWDFVRRLDGFGRTSCIEDPPLVTSSRRFEGRHPLEIF